MNDEAPHITGYLTYAIVLVVLLLFTFLSVAATNYHLGAFTVALALTIASIKVFTVLTYFMHLKSEKTYLKVFVGGVFVLFALVIIVTFIDYLYR
jgi:cytochrome c oxidase subunit 4